MWRDEFYLSGGRCGLRAMTPFLPSRLLRLTRASTNRSSIWTMTPRCFLLAIGGIGPRWVGGEIFSNVKAGIVYHLFVELKHSWNSPRSHHMNGLHGEPFRPVKRGPRYSSIDYAKLWLCSFA